MAVLKLSDAVVRALPTPDSGNVVVWSEQISGFGFRITANNDRAWILVYRPKGDRRKRQYQIGSYPEWRWSQASERAREVKRRIQDGFDPQADLDAERSAPTVDDLCARFIAEHCAKRRASTARDYRQQIAADVAPAIGKLKVAAVTTDDIEKLHRKISKRAPVHANRVLALLSRMFTLAMRWKYRADNPVKGIEKNPEHKRRRYVSADELTRLTAALAACRDQQSANIVRLCLLTGARRGEAFRARWADFDLQRGVWSKPGATTKTRTDHIVPLSGPTRQLLAGIERGESEYVFPANGTHRKDVKDAWKAICKRAGITGLRLHDLRHAYASFLASAGYSLPTIGALLGHTTANTTLRYSHLLDDAQRKATESVGALIAGKSGEIIGFKR